MLFILIPGRERWDEIRGNIESKFSLELTSMSSIGSRPRFRTAKIHPSRMISTKFMRSKQTSAEVDMKKNAYFSIVCAVRETVLHILSTTSCSKGISYTSSDRSTGNWQRKISMQCKENGEMTRICLQQILSPETWLQSMMTLSSVAILGATSPSSAGNRL